MANISFNTGEVGAEASEASTTLTIALNLSAGTTHLWCSVLGAESNFTVKWNTSETFSSAGSSTNTNYKTELFLLQNPTNGSHNIVITSDIASATLLLGAAAAYSGGSGGPESAATIGTRTDGSNISVSETTLTDNAWVIGAFGGSGNVDPSIGANGVMRAQTHNPTTAFGQVAICDNGPIHPAGAGTIEVNPNALSFDSLIVASFAAAGGGAGGAVRPRMPLPLLGVG